MKWSSEERREAKWSPDEIGTEWSERMTNGWTEWMNWPQQLFFHCFITVIFLLFTCYFFWSIANQVKDPSAGVCKSGRNFLRTLCCEPLRVRTRRWLIKPEVWGRQTAALARGWRMFLFLCSWVCFTILYQFKKQTAVLQKLWQPRSRVSVAGEPNTCGDGLQVLWTERSESLQRIAVNGTCRTIKPQVRTTTELQVLWQLCVATRRARIEHTCLWKINH